MIGEYFELNHCFLVCFQSEINEVFEIFHRPPPADPTEDCTSPRTAAGGSGNNGAATAEQPLATRSLSVVEGDNNLLPAAAKTTEVDDDDDDVEEEEKVELRPSTTAVITKSDNAAVARSSILPYPRGADCREDLLTDWAKSVMKECDELAIDVIDSRPSSLVVVNSQGAPALEEWTSGTTLPRRGKGTLAEHSYADRVAEKQSMTLMATRSASSGAAENTDASGLELRRIPKPDKLVRYSFSNHPGTDLRFSWIAYKVRVVARNRNRRGEVPSGGGFSEWILLPGIPLSFTCP